MAAILLHRKLLPLHASAIFDKNKLVLITGDSGAGKSTLLTCLFNKGYHIFSDDVVVLDKQNNQSVTASASYPMIKLWGDTLDKLNHLSFNDRSFIVKSGIDKYGFFFHKKFDTKSYPIQKIVILKKKETPNIESRQIKGAEAFNSLIKQIYRPLLIQNNKLRLLSFSLCTDLAQRSSIYEITRPFDCEPNDLSEYVEKLIIRD